MQLRSLIILGVAAAGLVAVACDGGGDTTIVQTANQSGISATGTGQAFGEPDVAVVNVGVNVERQTVEEAREAAAGTQQAVIDSLKAGGIADEDIQTVQFSVYPRYDYRNNGSGTIIGYVVSNVVTAKVRNLDTTGTVIDNVTRAGGNDAVVQGVSFTVDDPTELRKQAREDAVAQAREQAQQLADAAGAQLGELLSISENLNGPVALDRAAAEGAAFDSAQAVTPIEPGEIEVNISVNLLYALE